MKILKTVALCATSALLTLSVFFNIFFLSIFGIHDGESFKQALLSKEILDSLVEVGGGNSDNTTDTPIVETPDTNEPTVDEPVVEVPTGLQEEQVVYDANGITITYLNQETSIFGPTFNFFVVNNSEYTLWVSATDVYIDGVQADLSGGGVSDIEPGKKAYLEFTLWKSDYEKFTNYPSEVEFDIVIRDDSTWGELYSVEDLILKVK